MNYKKMIKKELSEIETPNMERIIAISDQSGFKRHKLPKRKKIAAVPMVAIIVVVAIIGCTAVAVPAIIRHLNAGILSSQNRQLDEVPEGYIGIYTIDDLSKIEDDLGANYILMNDIVFAEEDYLQGGKFENGWTPIGTHNENTFAEKFAGIFNGNGHIIKNLKIKGNSSSEHSYFGFFGDTRGYIINFGIEDCEISLKFDEEKTFDGEYISIGAIAARAVFVGSCYVENVTINIDLGNCRMLPSGNALSYSTFQQNICIGGMTGVVDYMDSCVSNADITVINGKDFELFAGIASGRAFSCITSYTLGEITANSMDFSSVNSHNVACVLAGANMPVLIEENAMRLLVEKIEEYYEYGSDDFNTKKFKSYFIKKEPLKEPELAGEYYRFFELNQQFGFNYGEYNENTCWYLFDFTASIEETELINTMLVEVFGCYDAFCDFCYENNIKCGMIDCYYFENISDVKETELDNFDMDNIWIEKNGIVRLRIFVD